jgi:hypothetical protein
VRTRDDENRHATFEDADVESDRDDPRDGGNRRDAECHVEQPPSRTVGEQLDTRFGLLGLVDESHDAHEGGFVADLCHANAEAAVLVDRADNDLRPGFIVDGTGLAGDHRFVD